MDLGIKGKWALVGGASKGLGWGCASALAQAGVNLVMVSRGAEALEAAAKGLRAHGSTVLTVAQDITTEAGVTPFGRWPVARAKTLTSSSPTPVARPAAISVNGIARPGSKRSMATC